jgi:probable phosphoglycerate mutase
MTELLVVRHGETDWNAQLRFQGHADPSLNALGREQARGLADELAGAHVQAVYSSDLARARETAEIVGERLGVPVVPRAELREIDVGEWQGLTRGEIDARFPAAYLSWQRGESGWLEGESYEELAARVLPALVRIASEHPGGRVLVVAHGGTIRVVRAHLAGETVAAHRRRLPPIGNCEVFRIRAENGGFRGID